MDKELLKWGIEHSDPEKLKAGNNTFDPKSIDPELVDFILNKRVDGVKTLGVKECVEQLRNSSDEAEKLAAFEHLHMLVEEIDHAISMENLGLWPEVIRLAQPAENLELRTWALWTMAAAAHHNPKAQDALLKHGALVLAFEALESKSELRVRQKAMLLISSLVKQSTAGFIDFTKLSGMGRLESLLLAKEPEDENIRTRISFFLDILFEERPRLQKEHPALYSHVLKLKE